MLYSYGLQTVRNMTQKLIACVPPVQLIEQPEMQDINGCYAVGAGDGLRNELSERIHEVSGKSTLVLVSSVKLS